MGALNEMRMTVAHSGAAHARRPPDGDIAIVVLTYNRVHLRQCVENVLLRTSPRTTEIVIWDNGSSDGTQSYPASLEHSRIGVVRQERNIGQSAYAHAFRLTGAPTRSSSTTT